LLAIDIVVLALAYYASFVLRLDRLTLPGHFNAFVATLPVAIGAGVVGMYAAGVYRGIWRYVSLKDLLRILRGMLYSSALLVVAIALLHGFKGYPRSVFGINAVLVFLGTSGARVLRRLQVEMSEPKRGKGGEFQRVVIVGAGDAADDLVRELQQNSRLALEPVGLVDDNPEKQGMELHGVAVLGNVEDLPRVVVEEEADEILIAIASASGEQMRRIIGLCQQTRLPFRTLPGVGDIVGGKVQVGQLRKVNVQDLLRRDPVRLDRAAIAQDLAGKRVLVTGAGGSIGSEICRQVAKFGPEQIVLLDHSENGLFYVEEQFGRQFPGLPVRAVIADITVRARIEEVLAEVRPHVVFHAAAHKHVHMMERNYCEAFRNNVTGTRTMAEAAGKAGVAKFVMISTDKAVNPTSVMGLSKRIAELVVQEVAARNGGPDGARTEYTAVRFGNVMGSEGSVIPLWWRQIRAGGPVTVTHPDVVRYFMTIPEAVQLVLQSGTMGKGGEIFLLDMGEPVKVLEMAREVIRLSGKIPDEEIEIKFIGLRPGEKLYEELITKGEGIVTTGHEKIMVLRDGNGGPSTEVIARIRELEAMAARCASRDEMLALARTIVPEYQKDHAGVGAFLDAVPAMSPGA
jgi:FlaA1/EpsC-like NDP-sugar epimerase